MQRVLGALVTAVLAVVVPAVSAEPAAAAPKDDNVGQTTVVRTYNPDAFELPEGIAIDKRGRTYVTMPFIGQLRRIDGDGTEHLVASLPTGGGFGPLGIVAAPNGDLYVGVVTTDPATQGVYRVTPDGQTSRLAGTEAIGFANDLTFGAGGTIYVADSLGKVWSIAKGGSAQLFSDSALLLGDGSAGLGFPIGANGITYRHGVVYVTNTEQASIVAIPVNGDGTAGTPTVLAQDAALGGADGVELDVHGNFYVNVIAQSTIVVVSADGSTISTLVDGGDNIDFASTSAFGTGGGNRTTLYTVNFSVGPFFGGARTFGPAVLAIETGAVGMP